VSRIASKAKLRVQLPRSDCERSRSQPSPFASRAKLWHTGKPALANAYNRVILRSKKPF